MPLIKIKNIKDNSYFIMEGQSCPFLIDEEREITRLSDGTVLTQLFKPKEVVKQINRQEAIKLVQKIREE